jgi:hypothetical protein
MAGRLIEARNVSERAIIGAGKMTITEAITSEDCETSNGPICRSRSRRSGRGRNNDSMSA